MVYTINGGDFMKYKTSDLAKLAGISTRTLRYYDQIGLLKPKRDFDSNYRFYESSDVDALQQILLFKEMGLKLQEIKKMMKMIDKKEWCAMLHHHLATLQARKIQIDQLITNVENTIKALKGESKMSDKAKFEGLKEEMIHDNDRKYKEEEIDKWGSKHYETSRNQFKKMTEEQFQYFKDLEKNMIAVLQQIKQNPQDNSLRKQVAQLHKEWISIAWGFYEREIHLNVVELYVQDDRFRNYYDAYGVGLAELLRDSVKQYV